MSSKYIKIGLRADKNLSDLLDPKAALENILDDISVSGSGFKAEDLQIINGIRNRPITGDEFEGLDGLVQTYSVPGNHFFTLDTNDANYDVDELLGKEFTIFATNVVIEANDTTVPAPGAPFFDARSGNGTISDSGGTLTINFPNTTHNFSSGIQVQYTFAVGTTTPIINLVENAVYFVRRVDANTIQFAPTRADALAGTNLIPFAGEGEADKRHIFTSLVKWEELDGNEYKTTMSGTGVIKAFDRPSVYAEVKSADFFDAFPENGKFEASVTDIEDTPVTRTVDVVQLSTFTSEEFDVVPLITLQDNITNFKTILGDPPYIGGGDGPNAFFISSDRINDNVTSAITGRSGTVSDRTNLANNELFTRYQRQSTDPTNLLPIDIIGPKFFWDTGLFEFQGKIENTFSDAFGGVQWVGFVAEDFSFGFETSGLFLFEENPNNSSDPDIPSSNENDFIVKKNIYAPGRVVTATSAVYDGSTNTTITYPVDEVVHVAVGDKVLAGTKDPENVEQDKTDLEASTFIVESVNNRTGTVVVSGDLSGQGLIFTHYFSIGNETVRTGQFFISRPPLGGRTQIRITYWFPQPADLGLEARDIQDKFLEARDSGTDGERRPFYEIYSSYDPLQTFSEFSYKAFEDNRAKATSQRTNFQNGGDSTFIQSNGTFLVNYTPPVNFSDIYFDEITATNKDQGRFVVDDGTFPDLSEGDWVAVDVGGTNEVYQIRETFIDSSVATATNRVFYIPTSSQAANTAVDTQLTFSAFKNLGLIGVYDLTYTNATGGTLTELAGRSFTGSVEFQITGNPFIIEATGGGLGVFSTGDVIEITGSASNNGTYEVVVVNAQGTQAVLDEELIAEGPVSVTIETTRLDDTNYSPEYVLSDYLLCSFDPSNATPAGQDFARIQSVGTYDDVAKTRTFNLTDNYGTGSSTNLVNAAGRIALVYSNTGLRDLSQVNNCVGAYGKEITDIATAGSTTIYVTSLDGITAGGSGDFVQFEGAGATPIIPQFSTRVNSTGTYAQAATNIDDNGSALITVTSASHGLSVGDSVVIVNASDSTLDGRYDIATVPTTDTFTINDTTGAVISLATGTIERYNIVISAPTVGQDIPKNATLVFIDGNQSTPVENKEFCVIPLNTAPPFEGISTGLRTPVANRNVETNTLKFESLQLSNMFVQNIVNPTDTANTFIKIESNGTTYNILTKSPP